MAGTREDELKAQLNPFSDRAGLPGYGADGWKTPGLENQAMRDEGRRREQGQASVARQARTNAKKALRNGDYEGWTRWQAAAGGTTLGIQGAKQGDDISRATVDKQTQNAVNLNPGNQQSRDALVPPSKPAAASTPFSGGSGSSYGTGSSVAAPSAPVAPAPTTGTATAPVTPQAPASGIPVRREGESQPAYEERLAQARGKAQGAWGGKVDLSALRKEFSSQTDPFATVTPIDPKYQATDAKPETQKPVSEGAQKAKEAGRKAREDFLSENREAFDSLDVSLSNAKDAASAIDAAYAKNAENRAATLATEEKGKQDMVALKERQAGENEQRRKMGIAQEAIQETRSQLTGSSLDLSESVQNGSGIFVGLTARDYPFSNPELFEGNWTEDSELLPPSDKIGSMSDSEIADYSKTKIGQRQNVAAAFNDELGAKTEISTLGGATSHTQTGTYQSDAFSGIKNIALGRKPNFKYGEERGSVFTGMRNQLFKTFSGESGGSSDEMFIKVEDPKVIASAQDKIINTAAKTGYPIWKDQELMSNPDFANKIKSDSRFKEKVRDYEVSQELARTASNYKKNSSKKAP